MSVRLEQIERKALCLPSSERAQLAEKLWDSLEPAERLPEAWTAEIERRRQEVCSGLVQAVPGAEVSRKAWELARKARP